jgi:hypothetical protein
MQRDRAIVWGTEPIMVSVEAKRRISGQLARIEARIRAIREMVEHDRPCDDVLSEIQAAESALEQTALAEAGANPEGYAAWFSSGEIRAELERTFMLLAAVKAEGKEWWKRT